MTNRRSLINRPRHRTRRLVAVVATFVFTAACSSDSPNVDAAATSSSTAESSTTLPSSSTTTSTPLPLPAPEGDAFYRAPDPLPSEQPGDVIWARPLAAKAPEGSTGYLVLYVSEAVDGSPIAVSGIVVVPDAPAESRPVLTFAHSTSGMGDACAPSDSLERGEGPAIAQGAFNMSLAQMAVTNGWAFAATDYEGLGTDGVHPYLVGQSEARSVLDAARAVRSLEGSGVNAASPILVGGHSQGGHAALMAGEVASTYAPELDVVGVYASAPPTDLAELEALSAAKNSPLAWVGLMMIAAFLDAYPDLPGEAVLNADTEPLVEQIAETCVPEAIALGASFPGRPSAAGNDDWQRVLEANSPGFVAPEAPVLIVHGDADVIVPLSESEVAFDRYCDVDATVERKVYPGANHVTIFGAAGPDVEAWAAARVAGTPAASSC